MTQSSVPSGCINGGIWGFEFVAGCFMSCRTSYERVCSRNRWKEKERLIKPWSDERILRDS
jgi:hypothetical protein